jgi:predicted Co/Zn/Cd cation transporter (cation efflux family)
MKRKSFSSFLTRFCNRATIDFGAHAVSVLPVVVQGTVIAALFIFCLANKLNED